MSLMEVDQSMTAHQVQHQHHHDHQQQELPDAGLATRSHTFVAKKNKIIHTISDHNNISGFNVKSNQPAKGLPGHFQSEIITCGSAEFKTIVESNIKHLKIGDKFTIGGDVTAEITNRETDCDKEGKLMVINFLIDLEFDSDTKGHLSFKIYPTKTSLHCHGGSQFHGRETEAMTSAEYFRIYFLQPFLQREMELKQNTINEVSDKISLATLHLDECRACRYKFTDKDPRLSCDKCAFTFHKSCVPSLQPKRGKHWKPSKWLCDACSNRGAKRQRLDDNSFQDSDNTDDNDDDYIPCLLYTSDAADE